MKKKRPKRAAKPPPARARRVRPPGNRTPVVRSPAHTSLQYKVVELSTVDEGSIERTINDWVKKGWNLDGVQFAMREASKRPAMAFVFFTREAEAAVDAPESEREARQRLTRLAYGDAPVAGAPTGGFDGAPPAVAAPAVSAHERLRQMAEEGDDEPAPRIVEGTRWVEFEE